MLHYGYLSNILLNKNISPSRLKHMPTHMCVYAYINKNEILEIQMLQKIYIR